MNALLRFGESLFPHLLDTVCQATLLVLAILGISRIVGRNRLRERYRLQTWCLAGLLFLSIVSLLTRGREISLFRICHADRSSALTMRPAKPDDDGLPAGTAAMKPVLEGIEMPKGTPSVSPVAKEAEVPGTTVVAAQVKTPSKSSSKASTGTLPAPVKGTLVVINRPGLAKSLGDKLDSVVNAVRTLVNGNEALILDAGKAYEEEYGNPLGTHLNPSREGTEKARWLRDWLSRRAAPGSIIVLLGDEGFLPTWQVRLGGMTMTTDSLYSDLNGDGLPDTAVSRILGSPEMMVRQLGGKGDYGEKAVILCSEDTRIHLETRAFAKSLSRLGYQVAIRGARDDETLAASDFIIHFGHGSPSGISNRFGEAFVSAGDMPSLPRSPVVFVDGCGTLPVGSPLLHAFLREGAVAYVGSTATVQGMIPARFTNELVEHFLRVLAERPDSPIPQVLTLARARYVNGHKGLAEKLRRLAMEGAVDVSGDESTELLTVAEWVYYGDPKARIPSLGPAKNMSREVVSVEDPIRLDQTNEAWKMTIVTREDEGQCVLSLYAELPLRERQSFRLSVRQNGEEVSLLDSHRDTVYQRLGDDCRGGYVSGNTYRARFLLPLHPGQGEQELEVRLLEGDSAVLTQGTEADVWPPDFEKRIGLRKTPPAPPPRRTSPIIVTTPTEVTPRKPIKVVGVAKLLPASAPGFMALDLTSLFNRPHNSMQVGGGDNASFKTWFSENKVVADDVPFVVKRSGNDVLVSANNTENVLEIEGIQASARLLHFLVWGYNYPREPAKICIIFSDGSTQECEFPLREWTRGIEPVAFDFENTIGHFRHAAIAHEVVEIAHPNKKIESISSRSGAYGLIAITLEED